MVRFSGTPSEILRHYSGTSVHGVDPKDEALDGALDSPDVCRFFIKKDIVFDEQTTTSFFMLKNLNDDR